MRRKIEHPDGLPLQFGGEGGSGRHAAQAEAEVETSLFGELARAARTADSVAGLLRVAVEVVCKKEGWPVGHASLLRDREPLTAHRRLGERAPPVVPTEIWHMEDPERHGCWKTAVAELSHHPSGRLVDRVVSGESPAWIEDRGDTPESSRDDPEVSPPIRSALAFPVVTERGVRAVLEFYDETPRHRDGETDGRLDDLGHQLGWALDLKTREMGSRHSRLRLQRIVEAMQEIASAGVDPEAVMEVTARCSLELTGATSAGVYLVAEDDPDALVLHAGAGNAEKFVGDRFTITNTLSGHAFRSGEVLSTSDAVADPRANREIVEDTGIRSLIAVPLKADDGGTVGLLNIMSRHAHWFDQDDIQLLRLLSQHMGSSLDRARAFRANVRLLDDLVRTAGKLEESLKQREAILDASLHPIVAMDGEGRVTAWSRAAEELYGWSEEEVLGRPLPVLPEYRKAEALANIARVRDGERLHSLDSVHVRRDGSSINVRISAAPISSEDDDPHVVVVVTDRSEMQRVEANLIRAERMESIGRLAGGVAHDFNNMLTAILGHADLLAAGELDEAERESVDEIVRAVERSTHITHQLLAYSRRQHLDERLVYPSDAIQEMSGLLDRLLGERIRLRFDLDSEAGPILVDPAQLDQVVMNLVVNARDAMPRGGEIRIGCVMVGSSEVALEDADGLEPGPHVRISVSDDGEGIPSDLQGRIFEPFFSTKGPGRGTGLGLATVYGVVHQSGGAIRVVSEPETETTFHLYFPVTEHQGAVKVGESPEEREGPLVLLVERMEIVERLIRRILEPKGYRVTTAHSHRAALERLRGDESDPDLIVTDASRGRVAFVGFLQAIREVRPELPVLLITDDPTSAEPDNGDGVVRIQKPFSPETLETTVARLLVEARAGA